MDLAKFEADMQLMRDTSNKLAAETAKLVEESIKLRREHTWLPFVWGASSASVLIGATVAMVKLLH
ncbi:hypothetical protein G5S35_22350 [Paraburkholderia tropica]|jgi:hypothetical protein|uniref:hypothetical protein n=1 Tax=Paraburkholderia tropica TaxID=92647 RepID=UPI001602D811|nr:hypothetical protein [Paraburkholderia tropica]QNB14282.1 hypothetical protein G5S35_22350 [Paraburkholderia tropica]